MTSHCDLCGEENCMPVFSVFDWNGQKIEQDTGTHTCVEHCKEATGMEPVEYVTKYRYSDSTIRSFYVELVEFKKIKAP